MVPKSQPTVLQGVSPTLWRALRIWCNDTLNDFVYNRCEPACLAWVRGAPQWPGTKLRMLKFRKVNETQCASAEAGTHALAAEPSQSGLCLQEEMVHKQKLDNL